MLMHTHIYICIFNYIYLCIWNRIVIHDFILTILISTPYIWIYQGLCLGALEWCHMALPNRWFRPLRNFVRGGLALGELRFFLVDPRGVKLETCPLRWGNTCGWSDLMSNHEKPRMAIGHGFFFFGGGTQINNLRMLLRNVPSMDESDWDDPSKCFFFATTPHSLWISWARDGCFLQNLVLQYCWWKKSSTTWDV